MNYFTQHHAPHPALSDYTTAYAPGPSPYSDLSPPLKPEHDPFANPGLAPDPQQRAEPPWDQPRPWRPADSASSAAYAFEGTQESLTKLGGLRPTIVLLVSLILLAAGCFSIAAQHAHIVFRQSVFNSRWLNASTVAAILAISGTILAAAYINLLSLIGRMWLWKQIEGKRSVKLGQVMVIASKGAIGELLYAVSCYADRPAGTRLTLPL